MFSVALDVSVVIYDIPHLTLFARYNDTEIYEKLCCLIPIYGTTKADDILSTFTDHFEERGVDIRKIFAITTDGAPAMVGKNKSFTKIVEDEVGQPILKLNCIIHKKKYVLRSQALISTR